MTTRRITAMPQGPIVDPATGIMTTEFSRWLEELTFGQSVNSIRTVLSGVNASRASQEAAAEAEAENAAAAASAISALANPASAFGKGAGAGDVTTNTLTISIAGGTAPYALSWAKVSGADLTVNSPTTLGADGDISVSFTAPNGDYSATYKLTITDSAGSALTRELSVPVTIFNTAQYDGVYA